MGRILFTNSALLVAGTAAVALVSGCGSPAGEKTTQTPTPTGTTITSTRTVTTQPPPTARPSPPTPEETTQTASPAPDAASTVEAYYAAINARDYRRAWDLGGKNLGGSFSSFQSGFATTDEVFVTVVDVRGDTAAVTLDALQTDGTVRSFAGTYTVRAGVIVAADIHATDTTPPDTTGPALWFDNCDEARAAGAAPIRRGEPGYAPHLDRDRDGVACEPED